MNESTEPVTADAPREASVSRTLLPTLAALAIAAWAVQATRTEITRDPGTPEFPALPSQEVTCPHAPAEAHEVARQRQQIAQLRWERAALDPAAAVAARADMAFVEACYRIAGDVAAADHAAADSLALVRAIERDRRHQQLRLRIAIGRDDRVSALESIAALRALSHDVPDGPYTRWLASLQRDFQASGGVQ